MKGCIADAIEGQCLKADQHGKVELVEDDAAHSGWQAVRLTTKGCAGYLFRRLAKASVASQGKSDVLCTRQPHGVSLYRKAALSPALHEASLGELVCDK